MRNAAHQQQGRCLLFQDPVWSPKVWLSWLAALMSIATFTKPDWNHSVGLNESCWVERSAYYFLKKSQQNTMYKAAAVEMFVELRNNAQTYTLCLCFNPFCLHPSTSHQPWKVSTQRPGIPRSSHLLHLIAIHRGRVCSMHWFLRCLKPGRLLIAFVSWCTAQRDAQVRYSADRAS